MADVLQVIPFLGPYLSGLGVNTGRAGEILGNLILPFRIFEIGDLRNLRSKGLIHRTKYTDAMRMNGMMVNPLSYSEMDMFRFTNRNELICPRFDLLWNDPVDSNVVRSMMPLPSIDVLQSWINKGFCNSETAKQIMSLSGIISNGLQDAIVADRFQIPGPSDLIRFAVREGWNPGVVQQYGYHKETPIEAVKWMDKQGYGQDIGIPIPEGGTDVSGNPRTGQATWTDLFWWSHWDVPSTGQGYEMLHRLYVDSQYGPSPDVDVTTKFVDLDLDKLMQVNDIPEYWRRRLQAISYQPFTRVDVRRMFKLGILDDAGVYHAYRAAGYNDEKAKALLKFTKEDNLPKPKKALEHLTADKICQMLTFDIIDKDQAIKQLTRLGYRLEDINWWVTDCDLGVKLKSLLERRTFIKQGYMAGVLNNQDVIEYMQGLGIGDDRIQLDLHDWEVERLTTQKVVSAQKAVKMYTEGVIPKDDLIGRLQNLNYKSVDIQRMIQQADYKIQTIMYKALIHELNWNVRQSRYQVKTDIRKMSNLLKKYKKVLSQQLKATTLPNLKTWLLDGLISVDSVRDRLATVEGWLPDDIERWIYDTLNKQLTEEENAATKAANSSSKSTTTKTGKK